MQGDTADAPKAETAEISYGDAMDLAMTLHRQGKLDGAAKMYETQRRMAPKDPNPNLGRLLHALGRDEDAMSAFCEALVLKPGHAPAHGRYSHREAYLRTVLGDAGLVDIRLRAAHLRMEGCKPVEGLVVSARSSEVPGHG